MSVFCHTCTPARRHERPLRLCARSRSSPNPDKPTEAVVLLPDAVAKPEDLDDSQQIPNEYKLNMQQLESHNLYAFTEKNPPEPDSDARGPPQAGPSSAGSQSEAQNGQSANPRKRARGFWMARRLI